MPTDDSELLTPEEILRAVNDYEEAISCVPTKELHPSHLGELISVAKAQLAKVRDRTELHEWGSHKGLPKGWRGRIMKGSEAHRDRPKARDVDCPAHNLIGDIHYCGIGAKGDLLCWEAYRHHCNWHRDRPICPECDGIGYLPNDDTGEPNPPVGGIRCPHIVTKGNAEEIKEVELKEVDNGSH